MPGPEAKVEAYLNRKVRAAGGVSLKIAPTHTGAPDRLLALPGGLLVPVEVKAATGRLSEAQVAFHARLALVGVHVHVVYSTDDVDRLLDLLTII